MKLRKNLFLLMLILVSAYPLMAQNDIRDSLKRVITVQEGAVKGETMYQLLLSYYRSNSDSTMYFVRQLSDFGSEIDAPNVVNRAFTIAGGHFYSRDNYDSATYYFRQAYEIAMANGYENTASRNLANLAIIDFNRGNYDDALESFMARLRIVEKDSTQKSSQGQALNNISAVYTRMGMKSLSIDYALKALRIKKELKDSAGILPTLLNLSSAYIDSDKLDSGLYYSRELLVWSKAMNREDDLASAYSNIGVIYNREEYNNPDSARYNLEMGLFYAKKFGSQATEVTALINLAISYQKLNNPIKAVEVGREAVKLSESLIDLRSLALAKQNLAAALSDIGSYKEAYKLQSDLQQLRDSIFNQDKAKAVTAIQIEYETEKKNQQITLQESELETSAALLSKQTLSRNIALGGAVVLVFIVALIYRNNLLKTKSALVISTKNEQLGKALSERESLLKEIHHRVKNNLQIIASLLYLQSDKTDDVSVKKLLAEGQGRVRSMALIHQKLYENDDLKHIPFEDYLSELVGEIKKTFGESADGIELQIEAKDIQFDVDTAVPLGLIINELSTNAFKYAFTNRLGGACSALS